MPLVQTIESTSDFKHNNWCFVVKSVIWSQTKNKSLYPRYFWKWLTIKIEGCNIFLQLQIFSCPVSVFCWGNLSIMKLSPSLHWHKLVTINIWILSSSSPALVAHRSDETDAWPRENDAKSLYWLLLCPTPPSFNRDLIISNSAGTNISAMEHLHSSSLSWAAKPLQFYGP